MPATRDGKAWRSQFYYEDWQGIRHKKNKRGFKTKAEAEEWERNFRQQQRKDLDINFENFVEIYFADMENRLRESTIKNKRYVFDLKVAELQTVSMTELYDTVYPPKIPIVDGLIYAGTYLFVGAPKVGKSFFMAQLGYHVSMGIDLWDYPVRKGTVLYLALEDDYARLQKRLSRISKMFWKNLHTLFYTLPASIL